MEKNIIYIQTPIGQLRAISDGKFLTGLDTKHEGNENPCALLNEVQIQIQEYFHKQRKSFDIPLQLKGTKFQNQVWEQLCKIPYGETRSYKEIAQNLNNPKAMRAVGMANNKNPIMIIIPCHRVIGANGSLVGYAGGLDMKQTLLALEKDR